MKNETSLWKAIVGILDVSLTVIIGMLGLATLVAIGVYTDADLKYYLVSIAGVFAFAVFLGVLPSLFVGAFRELCRGVGRSLGYIVGAIQNRSDA